MSSCTPCHSVIYMDERLRRFLVASLVFLGDVLLAGLMLLVIGFDRLRWEGFVSTPVSSGEFRDWLIILGCWAVIMVATAVLGMVRRRPGIAGLQVVVALIVLVCWVPLLRTGWRESHPAQPVTTGYPPCAHGNCPGG